MAGLPARYYRNYTSDDTVYDDNHGKSGEASVDIETLGWDAPTGYTFKEWNMVRDGTGIGHQPGDPALDVQFAIWEEIPQSVKYLTNDQSLTAVADAIREKGGTSASLVYPDGFVSAINAIPTGGGDTSKEDGLIDGSLTDYENPRVTSIRYACFMSCSNLRTVSFPSCEYIGSYAFSGCENLQKAYFPVCSSCRNMAFGDCSKLTEVYLPLVPSLNTYTFSGCTNLNTVSPFTECATVATCTFYNCNNISVLSFPKLKSFTGTNYAASTFYKCYRLLSLYLLGNQVVTLGNSGIFNSTPIAGYTNYTSGVYGSIYVPASLLTSYQTATNWTYFSSRFVGV